MCYGKNKTDIRSMFFSKETNIVIRKQPFLKGVIILMIIFVLGSYGNNQYETDSEIITMHDKLAMGYKICIVGDTGMASLGQRIVADALNEEGCNQVRHTGDMIYPSGLKSSRDHKLKTKFFDYYGELIDKKIPFYITTGNHDYKKNPRVWLDLAKEFEGIKFPGMYSMIIHHDICLITIDTNSHFIQQYYWQKKVRNKFRKKCKLTLAFGHHPRYSSGHHGDATYAIKLFLDLVVSGKVDGYFAGHDHNLEDAGIKNGTHYFISGAGAKLRSIKDDSEIWAKSELGYQTLIIRYENEVPYIEFYFYGINKKSRIKTLLHSGKMSGQGFRD